MVSPLARSSTPINIGVLPLRSPFEGASTVSGFGIIFRLKLDPISLFLESLHCFFAGKYFF